MLVTMNLYSKMYMKSINFSGYSMNSLVIYPPEWRHFKQNGVILENGAILLIEFTY